MPSRGYSVLEKVGGYSVLEQVGDEKKLKAALTCIHFSDFDKLMSIDQQSKQPNDGRTKASSYRRRQTRRTNRLCHENGERQQQKIRPDRQTLLVATPPAGYVTASSCSSSSFH